MNQQKQGIGPSGFLAARCLGRWRVWTLAGALDRTSLGAAAALSLRGCTPTGLGNGAIHRGRAGDVDSVRLVVLRNPHHWGKPLVLRDLHCSATTWHARLLMSLEVPVVRNLVVGLHIVHTARCGVHGSLLRHTLLLVLVEAFSR